MAGYYDPYTEEYIENAPQDALDFYQITTTTTR
jgi:hypothetical protein